MKNLPLENESFIELEKGFSLWLLALGYAPTTVYKMPLHIREFFFFLQNAGLESVQQVEKSHTQAFMRHVSERDNQRRGGSVSLAHLAKVHQGLKLLDRFLRATQLWGFEFPPEPLSRKG